MRQEGLSNCADPDQAASEELAGVYLRSFEQEIKQKACSSDIPITLVP